MSRVQRVSRAVGIGLGVVILFLVAAIVIGALALLAQLVWSAVV